MRLLIFSFRLGAPLDTTSISILGQYYWNHSDYSDYSKLWHDHLAFLGLVQRFICRFISG